MQAKGRFRRYNFKLHSYLAFCFPLLTQATYVQTHATTLKIVVPTMLLCPFARA